MNVALPSIREDLHFTETSLVWVVNAYLLTFGGFLLLGGRLGDLFGHRRIFLLGLAVFTRGVGCLRHRHDAGHAHRRARGAGPGRRGGVGCRAVADHECVPEPGERAKAMGIYGFVCSGGGSIGVLLGGLLTSSLNWHWIFLVNVPIGIAVYAAVPRAASRRPRHGRCAAARLWPVRSRSPPR